ncbi:hypothetical protein Ae717Ps2_6619c [Pseudonocardia sp. Ae717_Ps2]|nr:hypothetical protein Ae717Ps2_6619c [Pseudonocardia sp. Ae717_Ps2]
MLKLGLGGPEPRRRRVQQRALAGAAVSAFSGAGGLPGRSRGTGAGDPGGRRGRFRRKHRRRYPGRDWTVSGAGDGVVNDIHDENRASGVL